MGYLLTNAKKTSSSEVITIFNESKFAAYLFLDTVLTHLVSIWKVIIWVSVVCLPVSSI
jgi:hypothetical protein